MWGEKERGGGLLFYSFVIIFVFFCFFLFSSSFSVFDM